jgi:hypothetical protein
MAATFKEARHICFYAAQTYSQQAAITHNLSSPSSSEHIVHNLF